MLLEHHICTIKILDFGLNSIYTRVALKYLYNFLILIILCSRCAAREALPSSSSANLCQIFFANTENLAPSTFTSPSTSPYLAAHPNQLLPSSIYLALHLVICKYVFFKTSKNRKAVSRLFIQKLL